MLASFINDGEPQAKKIITVSKIQPSGRIIRPWPHTKEEMLEAIASAPNGAADFLTDAELKEINEAMKDKMKTDLKLKEKSDAFGLPTQVLDSFIFKQGEALGFLGPQREKKVKEEDPVPFIFQFRWYPVANAEKERNEIFARLQSDLFTFLLHDTVILLKSIRDDIVVDEKMSTIASLRATCLKVSRELLNPTLLVTWPPDTEWQLQLAKVRQAMFCLIPFSDYTLLYHEMKGAFQRCCEQFNIKLKWQDLPEDLTALGIKPSLIDQYILFSSLWIEKLDVTFLLKFCLTPKHLGKFNREWNPMWVILPDNSCYVRTYYAQVPSYRVWLRDDQFSIISSACVSLSDKTFSYREWQRSFVKHAVKLKTWSMQDICDG